MTDLLYLIVLLLVVGAISYDAARRLALRPRPMSRRRIILVAPLPIPAILIGLCTYVSIDAFTAPAEECGVDACGMAAAAAMFVGSAAVLLYFIGMCTAALGIRQAQKSVDTNLSANP